MGNKMDHASTSKLRDVLVDFPISDPADKDAGYYGTTSAIQVRKARAMLEEITEGTRALHHYRPEAARVSWVRRLLNWFMSRFWQSDLR